jgi:hypothetical protein
VIFRIARAGLDGHGFFGDSVAALFGTATFFGRLR